MFKTLIFCEVQSNNFLKAVELKNEQFFFFLSWHNILFAPLGPLQPVCLLHKQLHEHDWGQPPLAKAHLYLSAVQDSKRQKIKEVNSKG